MTAATRELIRRQRDERIRAKLGPLNSGGRPTGRKPYRRPEEGDATETMPGAWMPMQAPRPKPSPFFALATYEGEEC